MTGIVYRATSTPPNRLRSRGGFVGWTPWTIDQVRDLIPATADPESPEEVAAMLKRWMRTA